LKEYEEILTLLKERLKEKHQQYGYSYIDRTQKWMRKRLQGELNELDGSLFSNHLSGEGIVTEALDVAICALLIADKERRTED